MACTNNEYPNCLCVCRRVCAHGACVSKCPHTWKCWWIDAWMAIIVQVCSSKVIQFCQGKMVFSSNVCIWESAKMKHPKDYGRCPVLSRIRSSIIWCCREWRSMGSLRSLLQWRRASSMTLTWCSLDWQTSGPFLQGRGDIWFSFFHLRSWFIGQTFFCGSGIFHGYWSLDCITHGSRYHFGGFSFHSDHDGRTEVCRHFFDVSFL